MRSSPAVPELLAPAGDRDSLVAAVQNGAGAVYLGGKAFSARQYAANFGMDELAEAIRYAHLRGCRIYVTVNTLIKEPELEQAARYLIELYQMGADAAIVQDLGLVALARQVVPGLALHASTQMTVHNLQGVRLLDRLGVKRVVLAREMQLDEITELRQAAPVELEVFVHGALCVCYSGQCLMSSMIGGRSGNRGRCAQPCRLEYTLVDTSGQEVKGAGEQGRYLLSTRDLNMVDHLPELIKAGVTSLKIEGRMKRPEYVATVVRIYRRMLDAAMTGDAFPGDEERAELEHSFNRGFGTGYFFGNPGVSLMSYQRPSNRGSYLGRIQSFDPASRTAVLSLAGSLSIGDGIEVWVSRGGRVASSVRELSVAEGGRWLPVEAAEAGQEVALRLGSRVRSGDRVFKTYDHRLSTLAAQSYKSTRELLRIPLNLRAVLEKDKPLYVEFSDQDGNRGSASGTKLPEPAAKHEATPESLLEQLGKLGNTPFYISGRKIRVEPGLAIPLGEMNRVRRAALDALSEERISRFVPAGFDMARAGQILDRGLVSACKGKKRTQQRLPELSVRVCSREQAEAALGAGAQLLHLSTGRVGKRGLGASACMYFADIIRLCHQAGARASVAFPRILRRHEVVEAAGLAARLLDESPESRPDVLVVANIGLWEAVWRHSSQGVEIWADYPLNIFNSAAAGLLARNGAAGLTLPPELTLEEIAALVECVPMKIEALAHGPLTLMVSEYCAAGALVGGRSREQTCTGVCRTRHFGLRDRIGLVFPVFTDPFCRMYIENPMELCMVDHIPDLWEAGVDVVRIEAETREPEWVERVSGAYSKAIEICRSAGKPGKVDRRSLEQLRRELEALSLQGITRGHYFRGVE